MVLKRCEPSRTKRQNSENLLWGGTYLNAKIVKETGLKWGKPLHVRDGGGRCCGYALTDQWRERPIYPKSRKTRGRVWTHHGLGARGHALGTPSPLQTQQRQESVSRRSSGGPAVGPGGLLAGGDGGLCVGPGGGRYGTPPFGYACKGCCFEATPYDVAGYVEDGGGRYPNATRQPCWREAYSFTCTTAAGH